MATQTARKKAAAPVKGAKAANGTRRTVAKRATRRRKAAQGFEAFRFQDVTYQIDLTREKVYRSWVEVETSKQFVIMSAWRAEASATA